MRGWALIPTFSPVSSCVPSPVLFARLTVPEEVQDVDGLQQVDDDHAVGHEAEAVVLRRREARVDD